MGKVFTTEITSDAIPSDNPLHQRLLKAYVIAQDYLAGDLLEVGCGEGRGIELMIPHVRSYTAIDKLEEVVLKLKGRYPAANFHSGSIPPFAHFSDASFDRVVSFQVIEHISNDALFLSEVHRVLRPGGMALITTPNRLRSLTRNPWHVREYADTELDALARRFFDQVEIAGISGNEKVEDYYRRNELSVKRITRWDYFDLQHRLPSWLLRLPYEWLNRWNRNKLEAASDELVSEINHADYVLTKQPREALDLLLICKK